MSAQTTTGWLVQAATLLEITTQLVDDIGHGFSNVYVTEFGKTDHNVTIDNLKNTDLKY